MWNVAYAHDVDTRATESGASRRIRDYGQPWFFKSETPKMFIVSTVSEVEVEVTGENDGRVVVAESFESRPHCADSCRIGRQVVE
jgi:hypothetical protein